MPDITVSMIERAKKAAQSLTVLHDGEWKYIGIPGSTECVIEVNDEEGSTYPIILVRPRRYGRTTKGFMEVAHEGSALTWLVASKGDMGILRSWRANAETAGIVKENGRADRPRPPRQSGDRLRPSGGCPGGPPPPDPRGGGVGPDHQLRLTPPRTTAHSA